MRSERLGAALLMSLGILTIGIGIFISFFRPAMLPEDMRFAGVQSQLLSPQLVAWLRIVFQTWGAFIVGFGTLIVAIAVYLLTLRPLFLRLGVIMSIVVAFTRFLVSNIVIGSDFLWLVSVLSGIAAERVNEIGTTVFMSLESKRV